MAGSQILKAETLKPERLSAGRPAGNLTSPQPSPLLGGAERGEPARPCARSKEPPLAGVDAIRARGKVRVPVVLSPEEARLLLKHLDGSMGLIGQLLYGCGLRLLECLRLRIKDVDFARLQIIVRNFGSA